MNPFLKRAFFTSLLIFSIIFLSNAQLRFPKGTELNLKTGVNFLYFETEILFYTGPLTVDNYKWVKISDSTDSRWLIGSCFNGDCWNGLPETGTFIKSFGINDTTGFIRFHIETHDTNGKSVIRYRVVNKNNPSEFADLTFNVIFEKGLGFNPYSVNSTPLKIYRKADNLLSLQLNKPEEFLSGSITDLSGKPVVKISGFNNEIQLGSIQKGIYIIRIQTKDHLYSQKFLNY
jgi:hypothetical protein